MTKPLLESGRIRLSRNMISWREQILREFTPQVARLTLVADPDGLLTEEGIIHGLQERGFELIPFEDPVAFRFAYESKYRSRWDRGELTELVVVLRAEMDDLSCLPHDLLQAGRKLSFSLGSLFPNLSYPVLEALDRANLDVLYEAQHQYNPEMLGDNATKDFVLLHVFDVVPELIREPSDLLKVLLRRHFVDQRFPATVDVRFAQILRQKEIFKEWPIEEIVPNRAAFFAFLQERWPVFLDSLGPDTSPKIGEGKSGFGLEYKGPPDIPFDHDDIRVYVDNLFLEGMLKPVSHPKGQQLSDTWISAGLKIDPQGDRLKRLERLVKRVESCIPPPNCAHQDWLLFAQRWAELVALACEAGKSSDPAAEHNIQNLQDKVDSAFLAWMERFYCGLHNLPPAPPAMLHHVPRAMARRVGELHQKKMALVVVDGMSLDQWVVVRNVLSEQRSRFRFQERAVFAWVPTITSVSRQAIFSGKVPFYFPASILTTTKEPSLWKQFWVDQGYTQAQIAYEKGLGSGGLDDLKDRMEHPQVRIAGLVVDKVDKIMHGMELGTAGMHNQVRQWAREGFMTRLLDLLHRLGFSVWLTSDHGNIEARGCGRPAEGAIADVRGERVRIYTDQILRSKIKRAFAHAIEWPPVGLPEGFLPLLAPGRSAFIPEGACTVAHGGISIEEMIVPLVRVDWMSTTGSE